jgi:predicted dehydrogenase
MKYKEKTMKPVVWGILSVSKHYSLRVHNQLMSSDSVKIHGIASRNEGKATRAAAELGLAKSYGSYEALLADPDIEAVYIPLPNHLHAQWIKKAADAGKHVLCEKPFAMNSPEALDAVDYARKHGVLVMEAFMYRFHPQWMHARDIVRSGEIGAVHFIQTQFTFNNRDPRNIRNILEAGGGGIMDIGCYAVSCARFIMGKEPSRVSSLVRRDPEFGTDILASGVLDFDDAQSVFTVGTQSFPCQRVDILGSGGSISILLPYNMYDDVQADIIVQTGVGTRTVRLGPAAQYRLMFEAFSKSIREGAEAPTPPEDAVANMRVLDALFNSEKSGNWEIV